MHFLYVGIFVTMLGGGDPLQAALRDEVQVNNGLIAVGVALEIDAKCDTISARKLKGLFYLSSLKRMAGAQGYSDAEIDAYVSDKAQKARLEAEARSYLALKGAQGSAGPAFCAVGRAEIAQGTLAGGLLRE
ncbi:MAG: hypothetical protein ACI9IV_000092 [Paracoccaceae bacterium]|jgi:hypothetical protein